MITYGKTVFLTTTYSRDRLLDTCWKGSNNDFNRFIQKLRRIHENPVQYLRTIESHADGYPHFHAVLRFPTVLTINDGKYFRRDIYSKWKKAWSHGISDAQVPRHGQSPLAYIIKYTTKNTGSKIWMKYYRHLDVNSVDVPHTPFSMIKKVSPFVPPVCALSQKCEEYKIKQCTWSRKFFESLLTA